MLIADSGSTKTDYRLIDKQGGIKQLQSNGIYPYIHSKEDILKILEKTFASDDCSKIEKVFFYGTACTSEENRQKVKSAFASVLKNAEINIEHDLLGAARAACGRNPGLAGILGTGSNCCFFDGENIAEEFSSSGYILGDEGGGVFMGKKLLKDFIEKRMPVDVEEAFTKRYHLDKHSILQKMYEEDRPNKFLASFAMFIYHHRENPYIHKLINENFAKYFKVQVMNFPQHTTSPLNLVGSIAYYYQEYIRSVARDFDVEIGNVLEKPIAGLTLYHLES